ncbi:hypothetical protein OIU84_007556 [Salix udensis]|uniref:Glycosyl transferase CAP10 domain-containing protein n=1 Tax=Salix udensis TaxID=889485 RepID=A0AAD6JTC5_9ROSI|nr:hypothetical protein OIU84_007556 [Salix udensis]
MREINNSMKQRVAERMIWRPFMKFPARSSSVLLLLLLLLVVGALVCTRLLDSTVISGSSVVKPFLSSKIPKIPRSKTEYPVNCTAFNPKLRCPASYPTSIQEDPDRPSLSTCPEYFRWIHEDFRPWARTGISRDMVERAKRTANFRLVIVDGKAYMERYRKSFQSRDTFTLWGILQLLRKYPGKLPDLDMMFDCVDWPVVKSSDFSGSNAATPPALFRYCGDDDSLDVVFPDWSFWGWPEINLKAMGVAVE